MNAASNHHAEKAACTGSRIRCRSLLAVFGGRRLFVASPEQMARTVEALGELRVQRFSPAPSTGAAASARLQHEFPQVCTACSVGSRYVFQR